MNRESMSSANVDRVKADKLCAFTAIFVACSTAGLVLGSWAIAYPVLFAPSGGAGGDWAMGITAGGMWLGAVISLGFYVAGVGVALAAWRRGGGKTVLSVLLTMPPMTLAVIAGVLIGKAYS